MQQRNTAKNKQTKKTPDFWTPAFSGPLLKSVIFKQDFHILPELKEPHFK